MKIKYVLIVSLVLAILTLGAVSASEDFNLDDNLTDEGIGEDSVLESGLDEIVSTENDKDVESIDDSNFTVNFDAVVSDEDLDVTVISVECNDGSSGNVVVNVDDWEAEEFEIDEYDSSVHISLDDLDISSPGEYLINAKFVPTSGAVITLLTNETLTVTDSTALNPDDFSLVHKSRVVTYTDNYVFNIWGFPTDGTLEVFVDGNLKLNQPAIESDDIYIYRSDLGLDKGLYNISLKFIYDGDKEVDFDPFTLNVTDILSSDDFYVSQVDEFSLFSDDYVYNIGVPIAGDINVLVDNNLICNKSIEDPDYTYIYLNDLAITETGNYSVSFIFQYYGKEVEFYSNILRVNDNLVVNEFNVTVIDDFPVNVQNRSIVKVDCPSRADGNISVMIDWYDTFSKKITDGHVYFTLEELGISSARNSYFNVRYIHGDGEYEVRLYSEYIDILEEGEEHDCYLSVDIPKEIMIGETESISYYNKDKVSGNLTLYIGGNKVAFVELDGNERGDLELPELTMGTHEYLVTYSGDAKHDSFNESGILNVTYKLYLEIYDGIYGQQTMAFINSYSGLNGGVLTLTVNGKDYDVEVGEYVEVLVDNFEFGENVAVLSYSGDEIYPAKSISRTFNVDAGIIIDDEAIPYASGKTTVSLILPSDANGTLVVYLYDDGSVLASADVVNGNASISLSNLDLGDWEIYAVYEDGNYYAGTEYREISIIPNINIPAAIYIKDGATVSIRVPESYNGTFSISINDDYSKIFTGSCDVVDGEGSITISDLSRSGECELNVTFEDSDGTYLYEESSELYINDEDPNTPLEIIFDKYQLLNATIGVYSLGDGPSIDKCSAKIDGVDWEIKYWDGAYYTGYYIDLKGLAIGEHTIVFSCINDSYYKDSSLTFNFTIAPLAVYLHEEVDDNGRIYICISENYAGTLTVLIDGEKYYEQYITKEYLHDIFEDDRDPDDMWDGYIKLTNVAYGNHTYQSTFVSDGESYVQTGEFEKTYLLEIYEDEFEYGQVAEVIISAPSDFTANVTLTVGDKVYTVEIEEGYGRVKLSDLAFGVNTLTVTYNGDETYPKKTMEYNVTVVPYFDVPYTFVYSEEKYISLMMPEDANGYLVVVMGGITYRQNASGLAKIRLLSSALGEYSVQVYYEGTDYGIIDSGRTNIEIIPNVTMPVFRKNQDANITISLPESYNGIFYMEINGKRFETDVVGGYGELIVSNITSGDADIEFDSSKDSYTYYMYTYIPVIGNDFNFVVEFGEMVLYNGDWSDYVVLPEGVSGNITAYIDGEYYDTFTIDSDEYGGEADLYIDFTGLSIGKHSVKFVYSGNEYYASKSVSFDFNVSYLVFPDLVEVGLFDEVQISVYDELEGTLRVFIDDEEFEVSDDYLIDIRNLAAGMHTYRLVFTGNVNAEVSGKVNVTYYFSLDLDDGVWGSNYTFNVILPNGATGTVTAIVNGSTYTSPVIDGKASFTIEGLDLGEYTVVATYSGDEKYYSRTLNDTGNSFEIRYGVSAYSVGDTIFVKVELPKDGQGILEIEIENVLDDIKVEIVDGYAIYSKSGLGYGEYYVMAYCNGCNYEVASYYGDVSVIPGEKLDSNLTLNVKYYEPEEVIVVIVSADPLAYGDVTITVGGKEYSIYMDEGQGSKKIPITPGTYKINASYEGNDFLLPATANTTITIEGEKANPELTINASNVKVDQNAVISITVNKNATGTVIVTVDGKDYNATISNGEGSAVISGLTAGTYSVKATYAGDDKFAGDIKTTSFEVSKWDSPVSIDVGSKYFVGDNFTIAVSGNNVNVTVNGQAKEVIDGKVAIDTTVLNEGTYAVVASIAGSDKYVENSTTATFTIAKHDSELQVTSPQITVGEDAVIYVSISQEAEGVVTYSFNGATSTVNMINGRGNIVLSGLPEGTYIVSVTFKGNDKFEDAQKTATVEVRVPAPVYPVSIVASDLTVLYTSNSKFTVKVFAEDGNVANGASVQFAVNGKVVATVKTNAKGLASFKVSQVPGKYKVTVKALGKTVTKKLTVKGILTLKTVKVKKSAKKLTLKATLAKVNGKYLKNKKITFKFNGKKYTAKTNKKGVAKVTVKANVLSKLKVGKTVAYQATYLKQTVKKSAKVSK